MLKIDVSTLYVSVFNDFTRDAKDEAVEEDWDDIVCKTEKEEELAAEVEVFVVSGDTPFVSTKHKSTSSWRE